jgi:hypothetical protein
MRSLAIVEVDDQNRRLFDKVLASDGGKGAPLVLLLRTASAGMVQVNDIYEREL